SGGAWVRASAREKVESCGGHIGQLLRVDRGTETPTGAPVPQRRPVAGQAASSAASTVIVAPANRRETGQRAEVSSMILANAASSRPSTWARTVSAEVVMVGAPSTSSRLTVAETSRRCGGVLFSPSFRDNAML